MSGIKDVAALAGVSISTVSNVLNGTKRVSPELTKRVLEASSQLSYRANPMARGLKIPETNTIGVILEDIGGVFDLPIIRGINETLCQAHYQMVISESKRWSPSADNQEENLIRQLTANRVDGIIFVSSVDAAHAKSYIKDLLVKVSQDKYTPIVSLERDFSAYGVDSVYFDGYRNSTIAVRHLIDCGCRHIGCITGPVDLEITRERTAGFENCLREANLEYEKNKQIVHGDYTHQKGYSQMKRLLDNYPQIDGVFVENDQMALGVLKFLKDYGIKIPEQIKVMGYDDIFFSSMIDPSLSTIHIQKKHSGRKAAEILLSRIHENDPNRKNIQSIRMEGRLVVRRSTVANAPEDWILTDW